VTERRFPPPWSFEEYNDACFIVRDHSGQTLAYVYFEDESGRRSVAKLLTKDEARRIAANIAKLSEFLRGSRASDCGDHSATFYLCQFSADCTINSSGFSFRRGQLELGDPPSFDPSIYNDGLTILTR
jgi:hypothetical protein